MKAIKAGVIGGAGYTGGELLRLLIHHPHVSIAFVHSRSNVGNPVDSVHHDLLGDTSLSFTDVITEADVLFLCLGHGEAKKFLEENTISASTKIIDLSQDFRLQANAKYQDREFVYGLPELNRDAIRSANNIANPGCFATAIQLGLLPLAKAGLLSDVQTTGITGSTGAGQSLSPTSHFSWRANNVQAYKTLNHQHIDEITQSLSQLQPDRPLNNDSISFIPWRGDFTRGIFVSSMLHCDATLNELLELYRNYYSDAPFTIISPAEIYLKQVVNTNKCVIQLEKVGSKLVVHSAIDNLLKGASGQAVQNMNLLFGFDEKSGLNLKSNMF